MKKNIDRNPTFNIKIQKHLFEMTINIKKSPKMIKILLLLIYTDMG